METIVTHEICESCKGTGFNEKGCCHCRTCHGNGYIKIIPPEPTPNTCPMCGNMFGESCKKCGYTTSEIERILKLERVINSIDEFERAVGGTCDHMKLDDFKFILVKMTKAIQKV